MPPVFELLPVIPIFFQAEDGIRDLTVTGVQTCALPIYRIPQQAVRAAQLGLGLLLLRTRRAPDHEIIRVGIIGRWDGMPGERRCAAAPPARAAPRRLHTPQEDTAGTHSPSKLRWRLLL